MRDKKEATKKTTSSEWESKKIKVNSRPKVCKSWERRRF
jgi:hypothetical protein